MEDKLRAEIEAFFERNWEEIEDDEEECAHAVLLSVLNDRYKAEQAQGMEKMGLIDLDRPLYVDMDVLLA